MPKKEDKRTFSVEYYLRESEHSEAIQKMMKSLYNGKTKTMEEWKEEDEKINKGRC